MNIELVLFLQALKKLLVTTVFSLQPTCLLLVRKKNFFIIIILEI